MQWQLHAAFDPLAGEEHRNAEVLQAALASLARLEVSPDVLQQIQGALAPHWSAVPHRMALRVFVSLELRQQQFVEFNDWRFFLVLPGAMTSVDSPHQKVDLYLY